MGLYNFSSAPTTRYIYLFLHNHRIEHIKPMGKTVHSYWTSVLRFVYNYSIYAPVNITATSIIFQAGKSITRGIGPGTLDICGPHEIAWAFRPVRFGAHRCQEFLGLTPRVLDLPAWQNYRSDRNIYRCIGSFMYTSPQKSFKTKVLFCNKSLLLYMQWLMVSFF